MTQWIKVLKANPYHDTSGRFTTNDRATFVSVGGVFDKIHAKTKLMAAEKLRHSRLVTHTAKNIPKMLSGIGSEGEKVVTTFHNDGTNSSIKVGAKNYKSAISSVVSKLKSSGYVEDTSGGAAKNTVFKKKIPAHGFVSVELTASKGVVHLASKVLPFKAPIKT